MQVRVEYLLFGDFAIGNEEVDAVGAHCIGLAKRAGQVAGHGEQAIGGRLG